MPELNHVLGNEHTGGVVVHFHRIQIRVKGPLVDDHHGNAFVDFFQEPRMMRKHGEDKTIEIAVSDLLQILELLFLIPESVLNDHMDIVLVRLLLDGLDKGREKGAGDGGGKHQNGVLVEDAHFLQFGRLLCIAQLFCGFVHLFDGLL